MLNIEKQTKNTAAYKLNIHNKLGNDATTISHS